MQERRYTLKYHSYFDLSSAKVIEWWSLWEWRRPRLFKSWRRCRWMPVSEYFYPDGGKEQITGDKEWAKKVAKHFDIEVPTK